MFSPSKNMTLILPAVALLFSVIFVSPLRTAAQPNYELSKLIQEQATRCAFITVFDDVGAEIVKSLKMATWS